MGTRCNLRWREADDRELIWTVAPQHPIAAGVPHPIVIPKHEMYGEYFDIPPPDELVFISSFSGGEVFRSGCCFRRGKGRVFYFSPGHETYPIYHDPVIARVLCNAVGWATPVAVGDRYAHVAEFADRMVRDLIEAHDGHAPDPRSGTAPVSSAATSTTRLTSTAHFNANRCASTTSTRNRPHTR